MPIESDARLRLLSQDQFHALDYEVMAQVFAVQRDLGRLCDEAIYHQELADRCRAVVEPDVETEVPIRVRHKGFLKTYFVDRLLDGGALYELKTAEALNDEHRKQTLQYLLLLGLHHGKLVNFRPESVQYEFVSTKLTPALRHDFTIHDGQWQDLAPESGWLKGLLVNLLTDWGAFLDVDLYREAIVYFGGGEEKMSRRIDIRQGDRTLGKQRILSLSPHLAWKLSSVTDSTAGYESHLRRFLSHTNLTAIQWINFSHHDIIFKTLRP